MLILSIFLFILAAICSAILDTLKDHFETSIFKNLDPNFWNPNISWNKGFNLFKSIGGPAWTNVDAWHLIKAIMIGCISGSIGFGIISGSTISPWYLLLLPILWSLFFEIFYSKILRD